MKKMGLHEIRREFLNFFKEKEHLVSSSYSLVPKNDKSLLLIGAGMAPLKKYFTGESEPPNKRMATCQKCIRTVDIDNVGRTARHGTFFEMLGNFSFGDYFKKESIEWAWEFLTKKLALNEKDLWVSVYYEDDEAYNIWRDVIGLPEEKIVKLGKEDNFWELEVGPSGPDSEIFIDRGEEFGCGNADCKPGCDCDRFLELWNLVFTQFDKDEKGVYHPLPNPNIDTGMGLERITAVLEDVESIFDISAIRDIIKSIEKEADVRYGEDVQKDVSIRVITDHVRAMTFLVGDGVLPSNEGRGYVLRRFIRRAARHGKLLNINGDFLYRICEKVIDSWGNEYKDLKENKERVKSIIKGEEDKFKETIDQGISILEGYIQEMKENNMDTLSGEKAFKLYDTFGFPLDLTKDMLFEESLEVDEDGFDAHMEAQKTRARSARDHSDSGFNSNGTKLFDAYTSEFKGYVFDKIDATVIALFREGENVNTLEGEGYIILDKTPFYGESGGQVGDTGIIYNDHVKGNVMDTKLTEKGTTIHLINVTEGCLNVGDQVTAQIDDFRRNAIRRNHSATHLLHKALKEVLGEHVNQAGSLVLNNRFRFDFTHFESLNEEQIERIECIVNEKILESLDVDTIETSLNQAQDMGVIGLFEDKYQDDVRVIKMGEYSMELCGGTHVNNTSNIGLFKILSETGIAAGVRRIEAITGIAVYDYMSGLNKEINEIGRIVKAKKDDVVEKVQLLAEDNKHQQKEIEKLKSKLSSNVADEIIGDIQVVNNVNVITHRAKDMDMNSLRSLGDDLKSKIDSGIIVLASVKDEKISFIVTLTKDLVKEGYSANHIIKPLAQTTGGGGGGRPDMAQAGGKDVDKLDYALSLVPNLIEK